MNYNSFQCGVNLITVFPERSLRVYLSCTRPDFQATQVTNERQNYGQLRIKIESASKNFRSKFKNLVGYVGYSMTWVTCKYTDT